jgi:NADP-dependent 3-hydroxy acid dehydrogenase YdfG
MVELEKNFQQVHTLLLMCVMKAVSESIASLPEAFSTIDILINNAATHMA